MLKFSESMKNLWFATLLGLTHAGISSADDAEVRRLREEVKQMREELRQLKGNRDQKSGLRREDLGNKPIDSQNPAAQSNPSAGIQGLGGLTPAQQQMILQELGNAKKNREESNQLLKEIEKEL